MWTRTATNGILPRHTCSARCRGTASIRDLAVAVGAVPVSINQQVVSNTVCPRHAEIAHDARWPVDMWTTQGRCPHTHRPNNNRNQLQFDKFEKQPTGPEGSKPTWRQGRPTNPLHQLYAGTENHSQQWPAALPREIGGMTGAAQHSLHLACPVFLLDLDQRLEFTQMVGIA